MTALDQAPAFIQALAPVIAQYGYFAVGGLLFVEDFGVPAPGETVLIAASFYAGLGELNIYVVAIIALLAAVLGDNVGFLIGHRGGRQLVNRYGRYVFMTPPRMRALEAFFRRQGSKVIVVARFIEGLRQANGIIAGLSGIPWRQFLGFNIIGASLWVGFWTTVGYFGGSHIDLFLKGQLYLTIAVGVGLLVYAIHRFRNHRRHRA